MIETLENGAQLAAMTVCLFLSLRRLVRARERAFELLALFYTCYLLGDLYWQLHLFFYRQVPRVRYISDVSWLAAWLFLYCLLRHVSAPEERRFFMRRRSLPRRCARTICAGARFSAILSPR